MARPRGLGDLRRLHGGVRDDPARLVATLTHSFQRALAHARAWLRAGLDPSLFLEEVHPYYRTTVTESELRGLLVVAESQLGHDERQ